MALRLRHYLSRAVIKLLDKATRFSVERKNTEVDLLLQSVVNSVWYF